MNKTLEIIREYRDVFSIRHLNAALKSFEYLSNDKDLSKKEHKAVLLVLDSLYILEDHVKEHKFGAYEVFYSIFDKFFTLFLDCWRVRGSLIGAESMLYY